MKSNFLKFSVFLFLAIFALSCSKDKDEEATFTSSSSSTTETQTSVKLTAITSSNETKANYVVMMFDEPATVTSPLPPIIMQVTTDVNGLAHFDLTQIVISSTPKTYYFEAFEPDGENYIWRSITHPSYDLKKGRMVTSSILVN